MTPTIDFFDVRRMDNGWVRGYLRMTGGPHDYVAWAPPESVAHGDEMGIAGTLYDTATRQMEVRP